MGNTRLFESFPETDGESIDSTDRLGDGICGHSAHILVSHQSGHVTGKVLGLVHADEIVPHVLVVFLESGAVFEDHLGEIPRHDHRGIHVLKGGRKYDVVPCLGVSPQDLLRVGGQDLFRVGDLDLIAELFFEILNATIVGGGPPHVVDGPQKGKGHLGLGSTRRTHEQSRAYQNNQPQNHFSSHGHSPLNRL